MKKLLHTLLGICLVIVIGAAAAGGVILYQKYSPSKERADVNELFGVSGDDAAIILNEELQDDTGLYIDGQFYLPVTWVNDYINDRFYWDHNEKRLVYALPDTIVYADADTEGNGGKLLYEMEDDVYLSLGLISNYTDIRSEVYNDEDLKRVFLWNTWEAEQTASVKRAGQIRTGAWVKEPVVADVEKGCGVKILAQEDKWSYVQTDTGYLGYIQTRKLTKAEEVQPASSFEAPVYESQSLGEPVCLAWHQVTAQAANKNLAELLDNTKGINVVSPTWFSLTDNEGNFFSLASHDYVEEAHSRGIQVWALLDNFSGDVQSEILLATTSTRKKLIQSLIDEIKEYDIDGLNLDFESLKESAAPHYIQFIRELSISCRKEGIILSVDNYVPSIYTEFYNRKEQGIVADYVIIMGYDEHHAGGEMGSVASLPFVENGIKDTLALVPKEKVINAVPFYTRIWKVSDGETTSSAKGITAAKNWIEENNVSLEWDDELGQYYGSMTDEDGNSWYVWMEEERSLELKASLCDKYQLAGIACWKLGLDPEYIWDVIDQ